ncbi:calmodulin-binding transcription activator 2-like [Zingiber officinale]|uniref:calmodulin-binding transcription activator 2-like n=1 Tax=Zingiber officinale TaxID=94328 RepID=UPI001C4BACFC|nr:calmodulin-binding transcription activator 2-like [Zingiber officinale]
MASARRGEADPSFDIEQLLVEAQHRWLRPAEICEILQNHRQFRIAPEPPNKPPSGSLFLFDRKVLRYFRKDGHNWRKKKDEKTVKEAHERLKVGSVDMLHCYYAHGEENKKFQRRSYWMLEDNLMHIVLVHYREIKDKPSLSHTTSLGHARDAEEVIHNSATSDSTISQTQPLSQTIVCDSPSSTSHTSEYEDAESAYPNYNLTRQIIIKQVPDTTLSLRCGDMMIDE